MLLSSHGVAFFLCVVVFSCITLPCHYAQYVWGLEAQTTLVAGQSEMWALETHEGTGGAYSSISVHNREGQGTER